MLQMLYCSFAPTRDSYLSRAKRVRDKTLLIALFLQI